MKKESFTDVELMFRSKALEIREFEEKGLVIASKNIYVSVLYDCDFKAIYGMIGIPSASFSYPSPLCTVHLNHLDWTTTKTRNCSSSEYQSNGT